VQQRPEPEIESTVAGESLTSARSSRRGARARHEDAHAAPDLDARDRATNRRRKQAGPGRPGRGGAGDQTPEVPGGAPLPDVPPSEPAR
jgi:hypothetical protein